MYDPKEFEIVLEKAAAMELAISLIALFIALFLTYLVMKYAIRDGINASVLGKRKSLDTPQDPHERDAIRETRDVARKLPPMRAD